MAGSLSGFRPLAVARNPMYMTASSRVGREEFKIFFALLRHRFVLTCLEPANEPESVQNSPVA